MLRARSPRYLASRSAAALCIANVTGPFSRAQRLGHAFAVRLLTSDCARERLSLQPVPFNKSNTQNFDVFGDRDRNTKCVTHWIPGGSRHSPAEDGSALEDQLRCRWSSRHLLPGTFPC